MYFLNLAEDYAAEYAKQARRTGYCQCNRPATRTGTGTRCSASGALTCECSLKVIVREKDTEKVITTRGHYAATHTALRWMTPV